MCSLRVCVYVGGNHVQALSWLNCPVLMLALSTRNQTWAKSVRSARHQCYRRGPCLALMAQVEVLNLPVVGSRKNLMED